MNIDDRTKKLKEIIKGKPCRTGIPIMYKGKLETLDAYQIPLEYLVYNQYNGRIGSVVKSYERQHHILNPEIEEDKSKIEKFLWDSKISANKNTKNRLLKDHQEKHGIVTSDGRIIDGNRRAMLLNNIMQDESIEFNEKQHCKYFVALILPDDIDKKEILALETTYQMGEDSKVDYDPIEKYLKTKDLYDVGFSEEDIAGFMSIKSHEVKTMLSILDLMDDYLDSYEYTGMYTQLEKREDKFIKLEGAIKKYKSGVASMWDYSPEEDVSDLKMIAYDYIRAQFENIPFRNIIQNPTARNQATSFFSQKEIWEKFRDNHFDMVDSVEESSVDDVKNTNPPDLGRALRARDMQWAKRIDEKLNNNYENCLDMLNNKSELDKPLSLLIKANQALEVVDVEQKSFTNDEEIIKYVKKIGEHIDKFKLLLEVR